MKRKICILILVCIYVFVPNKALATPPYQSYLYDFWGNVVYSPHAYLPDYVIDGKDLGVGSLNTPADLFVAEDGKIFIVDSGNNRILVTDVNLEKTDVIETFSNDGTKDGFNNPQGVYVTEEKHIYVADTDNSRIVELSEGGEFIREIGPPEGDIIPTDFVYKPMKLVLDKAKRIYVIAQNVNQGIIELNADGGFQGFMGASRVTPNMLDYIWKRISTKQQRAGMERFIPTEYNNINIDDEGFLYVTTSALSDAQIRDAINSRRQDDQVAPIRRLNLTGTDVLRRRGFYPPVGDIEFPSIGSPKGPSMLVDVAIDYDSNTYSVLDRKRGRVFTYDDDGNLLYVFGGLGEQIGTFKSPSAIDIVGDKILVLDSKLNNITIFSITEYGALIKKALHLHRIGEYDMATEKWQEVLKHNSNCELAYIGLGKTLLRQDRFSDAMENFKQGNKRDYYSKAYQYHKKEVVKENFGWILLTIVLIIVGIRLLVKYKDDIFRKDKKVLDALGYSFHVVFHPFDGFWDLKHEKRGNLPAAGIIMGIVTLTFILRRQLTGFIFNTSDPKELNIIVEIISVMLPYVLWCASNWCLTTLMDGEGSFRDILIATAYACVPLILINLPLIPLSHIMTMEQGSFHNFFVQLATVWYVFLLIIGTGVTHDYSVGKNIFTIILTVVGMGLMIFIGLLVFDLLRQMISFIYIIFKEITFRL
mgnify:CR=1 FL=1